MNREVLFRRMRLLHCRGIVVASPMGSLIDRR